MSVTLREEMTNAQGDPHAGRGVLLIASNIIEIQQSWFTQKPCNPGTVG